MSVTIEQDLKEYLQQTFEKFEQKFEKFEQRFDKIEQKIETLQKEVTEIRQKDLADLRVGQARLEEKVDGLDQRLEKVETSQKNQIWALIGILGTALVGTIIRFVITALPGSNP